jgi:hypothetical protein
MGKSRSIDAILAAFAEGPFIFNLGRVDSISRRSWARVVAVLGGGLEVKEVKIPPLAIVSRTLPSLAMRWSADCRRDAPAARRRHHEGTTRRHHRSRLSNYATRWATISAAARLESYNGITYQKRKAIPQ